MSSITKETFHQSGETAMQAEDGYVFAQVLQVVPASLVINM